MLGLRWRFALGLDERCEVSLAPPEDGGLGSCLFVLRSCLAFVKDGGGDKQLEAGQVGVGEAAFTRGFLAFLVRSFSSSSDVVTSERFEQSTLIASELRLDMSAKEGAHLSGEPGG